MNKGKVSDYLNWVILILIMYVLFFNTFSLENIFFNSSINKTKLSKMIDFVETNYLDSLNSDSIVDVVIRNVMKNLDTHSVYIPKQDSKEFQKQVMGKYEGIGIQFTMFEDTLRVLNVFKNSVAYKTGIKKGDRLLIINKDTLFGKRYSNQQILKRIKDYTTKTLKVKYIRNSKEYLEATVKKSIIEIPTIEGGLFINDTVGYIKINRFGDKTDEEFLNLIEKYAKKNLAKLIIDLRDNPGGILESAVSIADFLLPKGRKILTVKTNSSETIFMSEKSIILKNTYVYILINENSASASEVLAGVIQDNDFGKIVGKRSYGKGTVQREMELEDGSLIRLTVANYLTPSGRNIHKNRKKRTLRERNKQRNPTSKETTKDSRSNKRTFETFLGRIVQGGNGIKPDITINKSEGQLFVQQLKNINIFFNFVLELKNINFHDKEALKNNILKTKKHDKEIFSKFQSFMLSKDLNFDILIYKELIVNQIKIEIANQYLEDDSALYFKTLTDDEIIRVVKDELNYYD